MFTGIINDIGELIAVENRGDQRLTISSGYDVDTIDIGASIACDGCCLTVVKKHRNGDGRGIFVVDVSAETLAKTTLSHWQKGSQINLERALKIGDELGGHVVSGHVDGVGKIIAITSQGDSQRFRFDVPQELAKFIAAKGSVTLNGTSLTVNEVDGTEFGVNVIAHTQNVTTWGQARVDDAVNVEIDMLARYVARLREFD